MRKKLAELVEKTGKVFALTHNYTGYPMVRQAREMVAEGELGEIRLVQAEYPQDWLTTDVESTRPEAGGLAHRPGAVGRRRRGRRHRHACLQPRLLRLGPRARGALGRPLELRAGPRARRQRAHHAALRERRRAGMLWASQVAPGNENGLMLRVYGTKGGLEWAQEDPN